MKKFLSMILAFVLVLGLIPAAQASTGDMTIWHANNQDGWYASLDNGGAYLVGRDVYYQIYESNGLKLHVFNIDTQTEKIYDMGDLYDANTYGYTWNDEGDTTEADDSAYYSASVAATFVYNNELNMVVSFSVYTDEGSTIDAGYIYKYVLNEDSVSIELSDLPKLDWSGLLEKYDTYTYSRYVDSCFADDAYLYAMSYDNDGNPLVYAFDLTKGTSSDHYIQDMNAVAATGIPGKVLIESYSWMEDNSDVHFSIYDVNDESFEEKGIMKCQDNDGYVYLPRRLCYDAANDVLYYAQNGELWKAAGFDFDNAVSVNDAPGDSGFGVVQMTDDGFILMCDYDTVFLRNVDPAQRAEITLRINDSGYNESVETAYYDYTNKNGDVSVVINRTAPSDGILQAMMNRSAEVDIYILEVSTSQYEALFNRGYLAELDSSKKLTETIDAMYPNFQTVAVKNGHYYALPISIYGYNFGYNINALEKLGMTEEDLPKTWNEFFDFIDRAGDLAQDSSEVRVFPSYFDRESVKSQLLYGIFNAYQVYLDSADVKYSFNTPLLRGLIERLENLDYEKLNVIERAYDEETDEWYDTWDGKTNLIETYIDTTIQNYGTDNKPFILSFENEQPALNVTMQVAFVNPFSAHINESIELLEILADDIPVVTKYNFFDNMNDPIRYPDFEEYKKNLAQWAEEAKEALENCDEDDREMYQENVDYWENELANIDNSYWMISPEAISSYRGRAQYLRPETFNCLKMQDDSDYENTVYGMFQKYIDGLMSADEMLAAIDKKVQMMRLEGN